MSAGHLLFTTGFTWEWLSARGSRNAIGGAI
jgi:hypothetical protein